MKKKSDQDFSKYLGQAESSRKEWLVQACKKRSISIHVDDAAETSSGVYGAFRAVASEAELERRLNASHAIGLARWANVVAVTALLVSVVALVKAFL